MHGDVGPLSEPCHRLRFLVYWAATTPRFPAPSTMDAVDRRVPYCINRDTVGIREPLMYDVSPFSRDPVSSISRSQVVVPLVSFLFPTMTKYYIMTSLPHVSAISRCILQTNKTCRGQKFSRERSSSLNWVRSLTSASAANPFLQHVLARETRTLEIFCPVPSW